MKLKLKDPGSAITHGIAMLLAIVGATPLLIKAARSSDALHLVAIGVFILTMILLYAASTIYHSVDSTEKVNRRLRKMDRSFWIRTSGYAADATSGKSAGRSIPRNCIMVRRPISVQWKREMRRNRKG